MHLKIAPYVNEIDIKYLSLGRILSKLGGYFSALNFVSILFFSWLLYRDYAQTLARQIRINGSRMPKLIENRRAESTQLLTELMTEPDLCVRHQVSNAQLIKNVEHRVTWANLYFLAFRVEQLEEQLLFDY